MIFIGGKAYGQDPVMSQFSLNKSFLNPAYAGYGKDLIVAAQSRFQWTHVPGAFVTNTFSADIGCPRSRLGFGLIAYDRYEGEGFLHSTNISGQVSVNLPGRFKKLFGNKMYGKKYIFSAGLQMGVGQKQIDWSKLTFADQYGIYTGFTGDPSLVQPQNRESNQVFDMSAGIRGQFEFGKRGSYVSFGGAVFHINRPVESFLGSENRLEPRYTLHFFTYFQTKKFSNNPDFLSVGLVFDAQQGLTTNNLLVYKDIYSFGKVGLGFRRQNFVLIDQNVDAIILQGLVEYNQFTFGYSYDFTISEFGPQRSFGTHEIGITYRFKDTYLCKGKGGKDKLDCFFLNSGNFSKGGSSKTWNP
ncbi:MAG: hypothetical protein SchgKO_24460 [Schleiferiaceae bacterium]